MDARTLEFIANACAGELIKGSGQLSIDRICTDSRQARKNDLFIALAGDRFDGHKFLREIATKGVAAALVNRSQIPADPLPCAVVAVPDTRIALGRIAANYRNDFTAPLVAVAGSNGKTTTKELIACVLRQKMETLWSNASFNNDIGVPLTLLRLESKHQAAVLEAGTNHPGELAPLVKMIQPRFGVITGIGREHLEFFRDLDGVAEEEGWLAELLPAGGTLFLNGDDPWTPRLIERSRASIIRVGSNPGNDWRASNILPDKLGATFRVETAMSAYAGDYRIGLLGKHQVINALFAIAIGAVFRVDRDGIERGLAECKTPQMRLQPWEHNGVTILDDAYNANADSMLAALQTLRDFPCNGRRIAMLGDMAELGAQSESAHEEVGRRAAEMGVGQLFAVGTMASVTARAARLAGLNRVLEFADVETAAAAVKRFLKAGDVLLLKASRAAHLERIAETLKQNKS